MRASGYPVRPVLLALAFAATLLGVAPAYLHLDPLAMVGFPLALLAALLAERSGKPLLSNRAATLLACGLFVAYLLRVSLANFAAPVVNLLVLMLGVRLLADKSPRHLLQLFGLALLTLAASSLLTLSIAFLPCLLLLVLLLTVGLVLLAFETSRPGLRLDRDGWRRLLGTALLLPAVSLPLMVFFYTILPRTETPLWGFLNPPAQARAGFSDEVRPGSFTSLAATSGTAFRVEVPELPQEQLYWRTFILNRTDGVSWRRAAPVPRDRAPRGPGFEQTIYLEPKTDRFLPLLDTPQRVDGLRSRQEADLVLVAVSSPDRRRSYRAYSHPGGNLRLAEPGAEQTYLQLPKQLDPRLLRLAERLEGQPDRARKIAALQQLFRDLQLRYSARDLPQTSDPVSTFLFDTRRGYCEYFASSFALLLRLGGVPARLAGGFLGGRYNDLGGYYLVGEESAHVWVEALLEDGRWLRVDPSRLAGNAQQALLASRGGNLDLFTTLADSLDHAWNRAVIGYDFRSQVELLRAAGRSLRAPDWRPGPGSLFGCGLLAVGLLGWRWRVRRRSREARFARLLLKAVESRCGHRETLDKGVLALTRRLGDEDLERIALGFARLIYGPGSGGTADWQELERMLRRWRRGQDLDGD